MPSAPALRTLGQAVHQAQQNHDAWAEGLGDALWGEALRQIGRHDLAAQKFAQARVIAQALDEAGLREWRYPDLQALDS